MKPTKPVARPKEASAGIDGIPTRRWGANSPPCLRVVRATPARGVRTTRLAASRVRGNSTQDEDRRHI